VSRIHPVICHTARVDFTLADLAAATSGVTARGAPDTVIAGVSIDSREVVPGQLFVPIVAERDGHEFLESARSGGAAACLTSRLVPDWPAVRVADTTEALTSIGRAARRRLRSVIGITGSVGKTTTKDMLAAALGACGVTHASHQSFNNELGVPLTLANAPADADYVVVEMGARGVGHIAHLCTIAEPTIGVVLAVAAAHTELFGDLEGVATAKGELVECLPRSGTAVLNADDERVAAMATRTSASVVTFGNRGDVRATNVVLGDDLCPVFELESPWGSTHVRLPVAGLHAVPNALAAVAAALAAGAPFDGVVGGLASVTVSPWRMEVTRSADGALLINDAYNANPKSMHAAIDALLHVQATRRVAVVGVMAELGADADELHEEVGQRLRKAGIEVVSVGVPQYGGTLVTSIEDIPELLGELGAGAAVMIKASRVAGLEALVPLLS
jgi:UDP-N-acetylmuramoyl-tripeptide--D-alanyl-D-alanine ligase